MIQIKKLKKQRELALPGFLMSKEKKNLEIENTKYYPK